MEPTFRPLQGRQHRSSIAASVSHLVPSFAMLGVLGAPCVVFQSISLQCLAFDVYVKAPTVNPIKLETGLRPNSAGIPYTLLLGIEAMWFPTVRLLLYTVGY